MNKPDDIEILADARREPVMTKLRHPDGDAIDINIVDGELVSLAVKQGPHEICKLAFTYDELGALIDRLQDVRWRIKP